MESVECDLFVCVPVTDGLKIWKGSIVITPVSITVVRLHDDGTEERTTLPPGTELPLLTHVITTIKDRPTSI